MHLICVNRTFAGMQGLREHVLKRLRELKGPTLFLFGEDAMQSFKKGAMQPRYQVKDWIRELAPRLPRRCKMVLTTFESAGSNLSNTAYAISQSGYRAKPKQTETKMDSRARTVYGMLSGDVIREDAWKRRSQRFSKEPYLRFAHEGKTFEVRTCADVNREAAPEPTCITLVPAAGYALEDMNHVGELGIARHRRMIIFNDPLLEYVAGLEHKDGKNVIFHEDSLARRLKEMGITLHVDR